MHIHISIHDGVPIYRQIVSQVKYLVASGQLLPGEELPAIRNLAKQLRVTPNTIVKAYDALEHDGVVHKRQGSGTFVSEFMSPLARREQRKILAQRADALLSEAQQMNFPFADVVALLHERHGKMTQEPGDDGQVQRRRTR